MLEIDSDILYENVCLLYTCHFVIFFFIFVWLSAKRYSLLVVRNYAVSSSYQREIT